MDRCFGSLCLAIFFLMGVSSPLDAYPMPMDFNGELLRWDIDPQSGPILYRIEAVGEELDSLAVYEVLTLDAASKWNDVPTSYVRLRSAADDEVAQITIKFTAESAGNSFTAGFAIFDEYEGVRPTHCSISVFVSKSSLVGVAKTLLHELGHCLGLGHSLIAEAIMSYRVDENRYGLDLDDHVALSQLYPLDEGPLPPGCAVGSGLPARNPGWVGLLWLMLPLLAVGLRLGSSART